MPKEEVVSKVEEDITHENNDWGKEIICNMKPFNLPFSQVIDLFD